MRMRRKKHGTERLYLFSDLLLRSEDYYAFSGQPFLDQPVRLEIGCGKGDFICGISQAEPSYSYYAMEKILDVLVVAIEKYAKDRSFGDQAPNGGWVASDGSQIPIGGHLNIPAESRGNVRFILDDAEKLPQIFPEHSVDTIYLNFSDPWPKKGYADRRLTSPRFLAVYSSLLISGGHLRFKTDNQQLFEYSLETIGASQFRIVSQTRDLYDSPFLKGNIPTEYEKSFVSQGKSICYLEAVAP